MTVRIGRLQFGFTHDLIHNDGKPYLERWILWAGFTIRLHRFFASDHDRAPHDHPWWFVTLPFAEYTEYFNNGRGDEFRRVRPFRFHFRSAHFRHRVEMEKTPCWTLIITGPKSKEWGFWADDGRFVHHQDWLGERSWTGETAVVEARAAEPPSR